MYNGPRPVQVDLYGRIRRNIMDAMKMLADLRQERKYIEEAILALERIAGGRGRRRGRPPEWMRKAKTKEARGPGRPPGSKNKPRQATLAMQAAA